MQIFKDMFGFFFAVHIKMTKENNKPRIKCFKQKKLTFDYLGNYQPSRWQMVPNLGSSVLL
jgi:hypothetical protein